MARAHELFATKKRVNILKKVKVKGTWNFYPAVAEANGKLKDKVRVNGNIEVHVEGEGIEVFPKQNEVPENEFGNAIRAPLGIHRGVMRRFWFYGADYTLPDQMAYLARMKRITEDEMARFVAGLEMPEELAPPQKREVRSYVPGSNPTVFFPPPSTWNIRRRCTLLQTGSARPPRIFTVNFAIWWTKPEAGSEVCSARKTIPRKTSFAANFPLKPR
jgi:hypothetical protein